jgi:hypothetical protein
MGTERMPLIGSYELKDGVYVCSEEDQYAWVSSTRR